MTPLEIIGLTASGVVAWKVGVALGRLLAWLTSAGTPTVPVDVACKQTEKSVREAFEAGMMCAADIVTHSGNEKLAGDIRKTVELTRAANDDI